jgi:uncharacterized protein (TIGR04255 family)
MMDKPLATFIKTYQPAYFERVGLRYLNAFSRQKLNLEDTPWKELLEPAYLGLLASEDVPEGAFSRCAQDVEAAIPGGCRMKLHAGPGKIQRPGAQPDNEVKFIFDMDLYCPGKVEVNYSAGALQMLHGHAYPVFRGAITPQLHRAMEPMSL